MGYNEYKNHLKVCEFVGREPTGEYKRIHDFLTGMWDDMVIVVNSQNNRIIIQKEEGWFIERDLEYGKLWCSYDRVWSFFRSDMDIEPTEIEDFVKSTVEEHLKCKVETPDVVEHESGAVVEEHLRCKVETSPRHLPCSGRRVEEHLRCKVETPFVKFMEDELW